MTNVYDLGDLVQVNSTFTDQDDAPADPEAVFCAVRTPSGDVTTYEYGQDAELVKDDTGVYHLNIDANESGFWHYRWYATGTGQAAAEKTFWVNKAQAR